MPVLIARLVAVAALLSVASTLGGCMAKVAEERIKDEVRSLGTIRVLAADTAPDGAKLAETLGAPKTVRQAHLTLSVYPLEPGRIPEMQRSVGVGGDGGAEVGAMLLIAGLEGFMFGPFALIDLAAAVAIDASDETRAEAAAGRRVIVAHDQDGTYRWHMCCPKVSDIDELGLRVPILSEQAHWNAEREEVPADVRRRTETNWEHDRFAMICERARAGEIMAQASMRHWHSFRWTDDASVYYWERLQADTTGDPDWRSMIAAKYSPEAQKAGEAYYAAHPVEELDCSAVAERLVNWRPAG